MNRVSPRSLVATWELVRAEALDVFHPGAAAQLCRLRGWAAIGLPAIGLESSHMLTLLDALRALALVHRATTASDVRTELVATLPRSDRSVLATPDVVRSLLEGARSEILVIGFDIREPTFRQVLFRRGLANVRVTVIGDRETGSARDLLRDWPARAQPLRALENVEPAGSVRGRIHAKVIVADRSSVLLGSANFTAGGLRNNIEFGVRATGGLAKDILRTVERLESEGWLVPAHP
jgi:phosphatidylserine/phosphatidylglycerophosphate/cardiolipin synthase-like enzyme